MTAIRRQLRELWTADEVSQRLYEGVETLSRLPLPRNAFPASLSSAWPDVIRSVSEAYGYHRARSRPAAPTPQNIRRMDEALEWLWYVKQPEHRRAVFVTSMAWRGSKGNWRPISLRKAARILDVSHETVRLWRDHGIDRIVRGLNAD